MKSKYEPKDKSQFITFYSYKGGVGRTMALANVACQMAIRHGKQVVCIDWDLEAPGLHYYFGYTDQELAGRKGLLDYLIDFRWQLGQGAKGRVPRVEHYLVDLKEEHKSKITAGSVRFMHCGATDGNYTARVQGFDWDAFYKKFEGFRVIETLKKQLLDEAKADIVLVDARAGQAEVGTTPTIQMPDAVVLLFTSNRQSLEGTERIARDLYHHPLREQIGRPPKILLVPSRVFPRDESYKRWLKERAEQVFRSLVERKIVSRVDQPQGLRQCTIPVDEKWATGERLPILEAELEGSERGSQTLPGAYITLAQELDNLYEGHGAWDIEPEFPDARSPSEVDDEIRALRLRISDAVVRGDEAAVALAQFDLARASISRNRLDEAETLLASSEAYNRRVKNELGIRGILFASGYLKFKRGDYDESLVLLRKALAIAKESGAVREEGLVLHHMGRVRLAQKKYDDAWLLFEASLKLIEEHGDVRDVRFTLYYMGNARFEQGKFDNAWTLFEESLKLSEEHGDVRQVRHTVYYMGRVRLEQGKFDEACTLFEKSLRPSEETGGERDLGITLFEMGRVRFEQGKYDKAWTLFEKSLHANEQASDQLGQSASLHSMAFARFGQGRFDEATDLADRALSLAREVKAEDGVSECKKLIEACERAMAKRRREETASVTSKGQSRRVKGKKAHRAKTKSKRSHKS